MYYPPLWSNHFGKLLSLISAREKLLSALFCLIILIGCVSERSRTIDEVMLARERMSDQNQLANIIKEIQALPAWRENAVLSDEQWQVMLSTAAKLQKIPPTELGKALYLYDRLIDDSDYGTHWFYESSKPMLLLRVMLDLPEDDDWKSTNKLIGYGFGLLAPCATWPCGKMPYQATVGGFEISKMLSAPISWRSGRPVLVAAPRLKGLGLVGLRKLTAHCGYSPSFDQYDFYSRCFQYRQQLEQYIYDPIEK